MDDAYEFLGLDANAERARIAADREKVYIIYDNKRDLLANFIGSGQKLLLKRRKEHNQLIASIKSHQQNRNVVVVFNIIVNKKRNCYKFNFLATGFVALLSSSSSSTTLL
jgi:hypothetical protein